MKGLKFILTTLTVTILLITGCSKRNDINQFLVINPSAGGVTLKNPINNFVWKGMNSWYNWQTNVPNLADSKDDDTKSYYIFLNGYTTPANLFDALLFDKKNTDRFSWFIEDYVAQNKQFEGISKSFGMRLQGVQLQNSTDVILYVRYVATNSPASDAGIKRGDIINAIDGIVLTTTNFDDTTAKLGNGTVTLSFATATNGVLTATGNKTIMAVELTDNPVYLSKVFDLNGTKVGYLVYNGFQSAYNDELNAVFADFKAQGITELVLDLRLNGGGSVQTSAYLASMIYAQAGTDKFADLKFNTKHANENGAYNFQNTENIYDLSGAKTGSETINRLNTLNRLYVLTSGSTASASEMIINGLKPYIPVKVVGTTTYGKNVGSITLYDSPTSNYKDERTANPAHKNAMQPIVFQIFNKDGQSDYTQGFIPDIEIKEYQYWDQILPFGDPNEVVLKAALDNIQGIAPKVSSLKYKNVKKLEVFSLDKKFDKEMYLQSDYFKQ